MPDPEHSDLVTIATTAALQEADVIRVSLAAAGIPAMVHGERTINVLTHIGPAIHPHGIRIMVLPEHAEDARALVDRAPAHDEPVDAEPQPTEDASAPAEDYARRAFRMAVYTLYTGVLLPCVVYYFFAALARLGDGRPTHPLRFALQMATALVVGAAGCLLCVLIAISILF